MERAILKTEMGTFPERTGRLFAGERRLVYVSLLGFVLAAMCAFFWVRNGSFVPPEGNLHRAFSFNAAIALYILSVAALMPLSGLSMRGRMTIRWLFIGSTCIGYGIETVQHFRGIDPRFSKVGAPIDYVFSTLFGVVCTLLVIVSVVLAVSFFRKHVHSKPSPFIIGTRYAFVSTMIALVGGLIMIVLQSRFAGEGNFIVIHGLGFHALQALPFLGWLSERMGWNDWKARQMVHWGSSSWLTASLLIFVQTIMGRTVFEWTLVPILVGFFLLAWLIIAWYGAVSFIRKYRTNPNRTALDSVSIMTVQVISK